jgi:hypothetical protein
MQGMYRFLRSTLIGGLVFLVLVGTLHILAADRVQVLAMSVSTALDVLGRLGVGHRETRPKESVTG